MALNYCPYCGYRLRNGKCGCGFKAVIIKQKQKRKVKQKIKYDWLDIFSLLIFVGMPDFLIIGFGYYFFIMGFLFGGIVSIIIFIIFNIWNIWYYKKCGL